MTGRMLLVVMLLVPAGVRDQRMSDDDFFIDVLNRCISPGESLDDLQREIDKFMKCKNFADIHEKLKNKLEQRLLEEVIGDYCQRKSDMYQCLYPLLTTVVDCANLEMIQPLKLVFRVAENVVKFACENKDIIGRIYRSQVDSECFKKWFNSYESLNCLKIMKDKHAQLDSCQGMLHAKSLGCLLLNEATECLVSVTWDCKGTEFSHLLRNLLIAIINSTPCGSLYKENEEDTFVYRFIPELSCGHILLTNGQYIKLLTILTVIVIALGY